ncbi:hypothetical protein OROMI_002291 [Orobanche minor]
MESGGSNSLSNSSNMTSKVIGPNGKLLVEKWPTGDFVGPNAAKFKTAIGDAVRLHIPINIPDFRKVQDCFKDAIWTALTEKYKTYRGKYRAEYLAKAAIIEDASAKIPPSINPALWSEFVDREFKAEVEERNKKFKANRSINTVGSTLGRKTYSQKHYEMSKKDPTKNYDQVDGWFEGHKRADGTILESAREVYDKVQGAHKKILESGGTSGDISCDALSQVLGKQKKNRVRGVGSYVTKTQLESACAATSSVNLNPSPGIFAKVEKVEAAVARVEADISEMRSYMTKMFELIQGQGRVPTPRTKAGSTSGKGHFPMESLPNTFPPFGSRGEAVIRVTLLDKDEREVAKGSVDHNGIICHGRKIVSGEKRGYIEEVLEPDCLVYDGPRNGNRTLNVWLDGGYIIWLEGRLKYDSWVFIVFCKWLVVFGLVFDCRFSLYFRI